MRKQGFTLIELLTVIAIICMLAAVLLPVFYRASEKARQARCASNAHQIALGVLIYASDYDETLPPVAYNDQFTASTVTWVNLLHSYVRDQALFICPSDSVSKTSSYGLNSLAFADMSDPKNRIPIKGVSSFQTPSQTIMLAETIVDDRSKITLSDTYDLVTPSDDVVKRQEPSLRHGNMINVAFIDGHVTSLNLSDFYLTLSSTAP